MHVPNLMPAPIRLLTPAFWLFLIGMLYFIQPAFSQKTGIKGTIKNQKGETVPFASVGVEKSAQGTMANEEGKYLLELKPGTYTLYFQCLGYQTQKKEITVGSGLEQVDVSLVEVVLQTKEVTVAIANEDPAYSIMRKAIARARINKMLADAYKAKVYIRGSGRIVKIPWLLKKMMKGEGIDENTVFFTETIEELDFKQPNQYKEKVIAARSTFGKVNIGQQFLKSDLYDPKFGSTISPLSPSAFRYYRFQYLGFFNDRGHDVFKIKVIPKVDGQNIWSGELYLIDQTFCIHSAHLTGNVENFDLDLNHIYAPQEGIWLPIQLKQEIKGTVLQIGIEAKYNASLSNYKVVKNEKLYADYQKLEQKLDENVSQAIAKSPERPNLKKAEKEDKKQLKALAKAYLKEKYSLRKKSIQEKPISRNVQSEHVFAVDSNAYKKDSAYWEENRAVPLTEMEIRSFRKLDSIRVKEEKADSAKAKKQKKEGPFSVNDLLLGNTYRLGKKDSLKRHPILIKYFSPLQDFYFNAVEGYAIQGALWTKIFLRQSRVKSRDDRNFIQFGPTARYSFAREKMLGSGVFQYGEPRFTLQLSGGTEMRQLNGENPISPALNSMYALIGSRNFLKLYETDFVKLQGLRKLSGQFEGEIGLEWANRIPVQNRVNHGFWNKKNTFESNEPLLPYASDVLRQRSIATSISASLDWYPFLQSSMYNGAQYFISESSPRIRLSYRQAIPGILSSSADFSSMSVAYRQSVVLSAVSNLEIYGGMQALLRKKVFGSMDALHFLGNQTIFIGQQPIEQFRNLSYYQFSSQQASAELHLHYFRNEIALGWLVPKKKKNWRELVLLNVLANSQQPVFYEVGYGLDKLWRFLHIEVVRSQWEDQQGEWRLLIGARFDYSIKPRSYERSVSQQISL